MAIQSTAGLTVHMSKQGVTTTDLTPTAITKADPPVVTVASTAGLANGDLVKTTGTDFESIDNQVWVVAALTGTTFELAGADTSAEAGSLGGTPVAAVWVATDMEPLQGVVNGIDPTAGTPNEIDISTFANRGATLPGIAQAGTLSLTGFVDTAYTGYSELILAEDDGARREFRVTIPGHEHLVVGITVGSIDWAPPIEGAVAFTASATMNERMRHLF